MICMVHQSTHPLDQAAILPDCTLESNRSRAGDLFSLLFGSVGRRMIPMRRHYQRGQAEAIPRPAPAIQIATHERPTDMRTARRFTLTT